MRVLVGDLNIPSNITNRPFQSRLVDTRSVLTLEPGVFVFSAKPFGSVSRFSKRQEGNTSD